MADSALQVGPVRLDESIHPGDPDELSKMSGVVATATDLSLIVDRVAAEAARLTPALALPPDDARTAVIRDMADSVQDAIDDELDMDVTVESVSVRGSGDDPRARLVVYLARNEAGRSFRGVLPYSKFSKVEDEYQRRQELELTVARAAKSAGGDEETHGEDPRVRALQAKIDQMESAAKEAAKDPGPPEPWDGYADANADAIIARVEGESDPLEREILKRSVRTFEEAQDKPRKGVLAATEPVALVEAESSS